MAAVLDYQQSFINPDFSFIHFKETQLIIVRTFVLVCCLAVLALGQGSAAGKDYAQLNWQDLVNYPADYEGRRVLITAEVVAVSADYKALDVFDARSKALIGVSLRQLSKAQRRALIVEPVRQVAVYGRVEIKRGQAVIKADKVTPVAVSLVAQQ